MRLIDADKLKEAFLARDNNKSVLIADVRAAINQAPEVDAVPVARCKDCKWISTDYCNMAHGFMGMKDDDYCSYGERREVDDEKQIR